MRAIIQSYTPQECERIINGQQTIKVCKTAPKETPFKVYIYCTSVKNMPLAKYVEVHKKTNGRIDCWYGKVIGEYVCEKMDEIVPSGSGYMINADRKYANMIAKGRTLHISNVKIYDNPKELKEFNLTRPLHDWQYVEDLQ